MINKIKNWNIALDDINNRIIDREYTFIDPIDFLNLTLSDHKKQMQVYWKELLQWLHLASITALMRNQKWIKGIIHGIETNNYLIFAASLRGYFEAFVDSYYSTNFKFIDISENFSNIYNAIKGNLNRTFLNKNFEESLIHYYSASKFANNETCNLDWLNPLTMRKYIDQFDLPGDELKHELYSELCEITHPASPSIKCFTSETFNNKILKIKTCSIKQNDLITDILAKYNDILTLIFSLSNSIPLINLRVLNKFNEPYINADFIKGSIMNKVCVNQNKWKEIESKLKLN